jgi:hypothetical protein
LVIQGTNAACAGFTGGRYIANENTNYNNITNTAGNGGVYGSCPGSLTETRGGMKYFGNYIHDHLNTGSNVHTFYFSNRHPSSLPLAQLPPEIAWNVLKDNATNHGLHTYDEGWNNGWSDTIKFHDNFVINQKGCGIDISIATGTGCIAITSGFEYYNNVLVNCGMAGSGTWGQAVNFSGANLQSSIKFYNNTIYGYGSTDSTYPSALSVGTEFGGTLDYRNNIVVDTNNFPYQPAARNKAADIHTNNLWYAGGDGNPASAPSWDTTPRTDDPLFTNAAGSDFSLQASSPAINKGADLSSTLTLDILGNTRSLFDIGAFEYATPTTPTSVPTIGVGGFRTW